MCTQRPGGGKVFRRRSDLIAKTLGKEQGNHEFVAQRAFQSEPRERSTKTHENTRRTFRVRSCDLVDPMLFQNAAQKNKKLEVVFTESYFKRRHHGQWLSLFCLTDRTVGNVT